jgi:hypothetical protein
MALDGGFWRETCRLDCLVTTRLIGVCIGGWVTWLGPGCGLEGVLALEGVLRVDMGRSYCA